MTGTLVLHGEEIQIDCFSQRDHSWGKRRYTTNPRSDFPWAIASEDHAFHLWAISDLPFDDDPIIGTTENVITGWYRKDGVTSKVISGSRHVIERGDDGRPLSVRLEATDELGRELHAVGTAKNWLNWYAYQMFQWWSLAEFEFDGVHAYGEMQDLFPIHQGRQFVRSLKK